MITVPIVQTIIAGIAFGLWPLLMNRSGLNGNVAALVLTVTGLVLILPIAFRSIWAEPEIFTDVRWGMAISAGIAGAVGVLIFNSALAQASMHYVSILFMLLLAMQAMVSAGHSVWVNGGMSHSHIIGFILTLTGSLLLLRTS